MSSPKNKSTKIKNAVIFSITAALMIASPILVNNGYLLTQKAAQELILEKSFDPSLKKANKIFSNQTIKVKSRVNNFWYLIDNNKWNIKNKDISGRTQNAFEFTINHISKNVSGMVISDDVEYDPQRISDFQINLSKEKSDNLEQINSFSTNINGIKSVITKWKSESEIGPMTYLGLFASGNNSSVRLIFATQSKHFDILENDFNSFISGIHTN
jgi:hypothetical protein